MTMCNMRQQLKKLTDAGKLKRFCRIPVIPPAVSGTIHNLDTSKWKLYRPIVFSF